MGIGRGMSAHRGSGSPRPGAVGGVQLTHSQPRSVRAPTPLHRPATVPEGMGGVTDCRRRHIVSAFVGLSHAAGESVNEGLQPADTFACSSSESTPEKIASRGPRSRTPVNSVT